MRVTAAYLERLARDWQDAYQAINDQTAPAVVWEKGWFLISGASSTKYRRAKLEEMRDRLRDRLRQKEQRK